MLPSCNLHFNSKDMLICGIIFSGGSIFMDIYRTGAPPPHPVENCGGGVFVNFDFIKCIYFHCILHAMFTYVFYSLLSLQKHKVCLKEHQNNLQTPRNIPHKGCAPRFCNSWIHHCFSNLHPHKLST